MLNVLSSVTASPYNLSANCQLELRNMNITKNTFKTRLHIFTARFKQFKFKQRLFQCIEEKRMLKTKKRKMK